MLVNPKPKSDANIEELKSAVERRDSEIMKTFIHSFKFPINIPQSNELLLILQQRDLARALLKILL